MEWLSWIDNRTLMACLCILVGVFAVMLLGLRSFYPRLAGISWVTAGFVTGALATLLLLTVGRLPWLISTVAGGGLAFVSAICLYVGVLKFCRDQARKTRRSDLVPPAAPVVLPFNGLPLLLIASAIASAVLFYCTEVRLNTAACVVAIASTLALSRGLMAWALYRAAAGRRHMLAFAGSMSFFALVSASHAVQSLIYPSMVDIMHGDRTQTLTLALSLTFFCIQGVFYLLMFAGSVAETIEHRAQLDYVLGTLNRRGIEDALTAEISRTRRSGGVVAILLVDVDHFKSVNDRFGHAAGDEALRCVARSIGCAVRVYDLLGRFGGDEFLVLLPQTGGANAMRTAERIREAVSAETGLPGGVRLTLSIGATTGAYPEASIDIIARADAALYEAKRAGRDCARLNPRPTLSPEPAKATPTLEASDALPRKK